LFEIDDVGLIAHCFNERAQRQIAGAAQQTFGGAHDQSQGFRAEGVVAQAGPVQLAEDERFEGFKSQAGQQHRIGDAGTDLLIDRQGQGLEQRGLADEHEVVRAGKILAEQAQFAQAIGRHGRRQ